MKIITSFVNTKYVRLMYSVKNSIFLLLTQYLCPRFSISTRKRVLSNKRSGNLKNSPMLSAFTCVWEAEYKNYPQHNLKFFVIGLRLQRSALSLKNRRRMRKLAQENNLKHKNQNFSFRCVLKLLVCEK